RLHDTVEAALKPLGFPPDSRKFTAHATLARVKKMSKDQKMSLVDTIKRLSDVKLGEMEVNNIRFKKSTLTPNGPIYETLHEVRL
ncbi:MAG: 2'-5' RNA ligase family protein, partial [Methanocellales archaeon]|nr:2'-5' RNA ligase family protein [Methanocellales archaeon]